jgi:phenylpropionate dioxygenase-like ring-hydroxylating dioxygenase large terminal subunit
MYRCLLKGRARCRRQFIHQRIFSHELRDIFAQDWFCVGRATALSKPGDYVTVELAGQAIIVLRNKEDQLRAMSNVCRHRMSTLLEGRGNKSSIVCPIMLGLTTWMGHFVARLQ